jgi:hypothetical protein
MCVLAVVWIAAVAIGLCVLWTASRHSGGLEGAIGDASRWGSWIEGLVKLLAIPTVSLLWFLPLSLHTVVLTAEGISLVRCGWSVWRLSWDDFAGWRWYLQPERQIIALQLVDQSGSSRTLRMQRKQYDVLITTLRRRARGRRELPCRLQSVDKRWVERLSVGYLLFLLFGAPAFGVFGFDPGAPSTHLFFFVLLGSPVLILCLWLHSPED